MHSTKGSPDPADIIWERKSPLPYKLCCIPNIGNDSSFRQQYLGEWKVDERGDILHKRLSEYYKNTEHMDNRDAAKKWREFRNWCDNSGYSREEINKAKQSCRYGK